MLVLSPCLLCSVRLRVWYACIDPVLALRCGGGCRWLLQQGREEEAKEALRTIRQEDELEAEITAVRGHDTLI